MNLEALEQSADHVAARRDELRDVFSFRLFTRAPAVIRLLLREDAKFVKELLGGLLAFRESLPVFDSTSPRLRALGARLHEHGVEPKHYPVVGEVLIASMAEVVGEAWRPEFEEAWSDVFVIVAGAMIDGAMEVTLRTAA